MLAKESKMMNRMEVVPQSRAPTNCPCWRPVDMVDVGVSCYGCEARHGSESGGFGEKSERTLQDYLADGNGHPMVSLTTPSQGTVAGPSRDRSATDRTKNEPGGGNLWNGFSTSDLQSDSTFSFGSRFFDHALPITAP